MFRRGIFALAIGGLVAVNTAPASAGGLAPIDDITLTAGTPEKLSELPGTEYVITVSPSDSFNYFDYDLGEAGDGTTWNLTVVGGNPVGPFSVGTIGNYILSSTDTTIDLTLVSGEDVATIELNDSPTISATPVPAALPLFAAGLGAIGLMGRRRQRNTTGLPVTA